MKYKVGDKVRVASNLMIGARYGNCTFLKAKERYKGKIVTISEVHKDYYYIKGDEDYGHYTDEMLEPVEEMSAEEALKTYAEICSTYHFCDGCPIGDGDVKDPKECNTILSECTEDTLLRLKQWKADHEKKPIETKWVWYVKIIEADTHLLKHEELLELDFSIPMDRKKEEILKKYCAEHDGKYYVTDERRCVVKE